MLGPQFPFHFRVERADAEVKAAAAVEVAAARAERDRIAAMVAFLAAFSGPPRSAGRALCGSYTAAETGPQLRRFVEAGGTILAVGRSATSLAE